MTLQSIKKKAIPILKKHDVVKASLFGSRVRNEQRPDSDIDMLVQLAENKSLLDLVNLENDLQELFKIKVDVLTYASIHPRLKNIILAEQEVFYEKESTSIS